MPDPNPAVMDFLLTRRSRPARTLTLPVPGREQLLRILTAAVRVPDHGKLEPWRFVVLDKPALDRLARLAAVRGPATGRDAEQTAKGVAQFTDSNLTIAVVKRPCSTEKIPEIEQVLSTGAVCVTLLNAAAAEGYGANWLTGWVASDEVICREGLCLQPGEWVAGLVHLGTETSVPPDRPRPDLEKIVTWAPA
ncbi:nitroreductase [Frigidibacter sp. SD6-1]|uniref:nitroreductase family protein n=1 Tax=Frigidibacter sp. SD6-1 TaxID=3032581 RepID=UPI0024DFB550|nr:nitroreductase [Frigidibacter sp. SD6-1]